MVDIRLPASGAIRVRWYPTGAFANYKSPTVAELNAGLNIVDAISWNDFDFGVQASNTNDDPALSNKSNVQTRGASQFGGSMSFYYPKVFGDTTNVYSNTFEALKAPGTTGYIVTSIDGDLSANATPLYAGGAIINFADGDWVNVYKVTTGAYTDNITGEDAFRQTITFLSQGELAVYVVAKTATITVAVTPTTSTGVSGTKVQLAATVNARRYTRGLYWTSSAPAIATVSQNGVVTRVAVGTATITGTYLPTGGTGTMTVTNS